MNIGEPNSLLPWDAGRCSNQNYQDKFLTAKSVKSHLKKY